jgi:hypothetical protein
VEKKGGGDEGVKEIELKTPDNNALFDLSNTENITFRWTQIEGVTSYTLKFAPTETALANTRVTINVIFFDLQNNTMPKFHYRENCSHTLWQSFSDVKIVPILYGSHFLL